MSKVIEYHPQGAMSGYVVKDENGKQVELKKGDRVTLSDDDASTLMSNHPEAFLECLDNGAPVDDTEKTDETDPEKTDDPDSDPDADPDADGEDEVDNDAPVLPDLEKLSLRQLKKYCKKHDIQIDDIKKIDDPTVLRTLIQASVDETNS